jgi:hypothetical protein
METSMKTMLGGWEDVQRLQGLERAARASSPEPLGAVSLRRCVAVAPKDSSSAAATARRSSLRKTCLGGVSVPLPPWPAAERLAPRHATRQQAFTRPVLGAALDGTPGAARSARLALDETCEIQDVDLVLLMAQPVPPRPPAAAQRAGGLRRGGTLVEPALCIIAPPRRGWAGLLPAFVHWVRALISNR